MRLIVLLLAAVLAAPFLTGCKTTQPDGTKVYDPVKTEQVKAAVKPLVTGLIRRGLQSETNAVPYVRQLQVVFEHMRDTKQFAPSYLDSLLNEGLKNLPSDKEWVNYLLDGKNTLVALYAILWDSKTKVDLSEEEWGYHLTDFFAQTIKQALEEAGI